MSWRVEQIGRAVLYLGDALAVIPQLGGVDAVFADGPYSSGGAFRGDRTAATTVKYVNPQNRGAHREFSGDTRDQRAYGYWSALWLSAALQATREGGLCALFTDWRQLPTTTDAMQAGGWVWRGVVPWDKTESARPQKGRYRNQCEYVVWGSAGPMAIEGPCAPGFFTGAVTRGGKDHIAEKPLALMEALLQIAGEVVLDPFMGSGSTGVAAVRTGRRFIGIEIDPGHYATARRRIAEAQSLELAA